MFGDNTAERPSPFQLRNRFLHDAWAELTGMEQEEACTEFMDMSAPLLDDRDISYEDP